MLFKAKYGSNFAEDRLVPYSTSPIMVVQRDKRTGSVRAYYCKFALLLQCHWSVFQTNIEFGHITTSTACSRGRRHTELDACSRRPISARDARHARRAPPVGARDSEASRVRATLAPRAPPAAAQSLARSARAGVVLARS